ncbi:hypothetical protein SZ25_00298, partial [Candidatus Arcanobacter lacustris]
NLETQHNATSTKVDNLEEDFEKHVETYNYNTMHETINDLCTDYSDASHITEKIELCKDVTSYALHNLTIPNFQCISDCATLISARQNYNLTQSTIDMANNKELQTVNGKKTINNQIMQIEANKIAELIFKTNKMHLVKTKDKESTQFVPDTVSEAMLNEIGFTLGNDYHLECLTNSPKSIKYNKDSKLCEAPKNFKYNNELTVNNYYYSNEGDVDIAKLLGESDQKAPFYTIVKG